MDRGKPEDEGGHGSCAPERPRRAGSEPAERRVRATGATGRSGGERKTRGDTSSLCGSFLLVSGDRGRGGDDWVLILSSTGERTWLSFAPETQQGQGSPGAGSLSSRPLLPRLGSRRDALPVRLWTSLETAGRVPTFPTHTRVRTHPHSHPPFQNNLKRLPATGKHQPLKIRPERDKATKI